MKTNTITMQAGPQGAQPVGAGTRLRNAINKMTPGSNRQQDSFDSALSEARDNRSAQGTGERAAQTERPKTAEAARPEAVQDKSEGQPANTESTAKAEQTAKEAGQSSRETAAQSAKDVVQEAAEAVSDETAGLVKQEGTGKTADNGEAKAVTEAEADVEEPAEQTAAAATTLNGMLMAMAAQAEAATQAEIAPEMEAAPETAAISEAGLPTENTPQTAAELQPGTPGTPGTPATEKNFAALDSLLPQDADKAAQAVQNQQLMDMLSGKTNSVNLAVQPKAMPAAEAMNTSLASAAADEAAITSGQLGALADSAAEAPALTEVAAANVNVGPAATTVEGAMTGTVVAEAAQTGVSMPGGMPAEAELSMARAAQGNTPENADAANLAQTTGTTIQGSANSLTDNAAPSRDTGSSLWQGIPMAIENAVSMPRDESNRQNLGDMLRQQNQEQAAQAVPAASEGEASMPGAAFTPTMAEEIVPNAGQQSQPMTAANAFAPAAGFTNAAAAAETAAPESAAPVRDTYEVVRQIVDQARLIRSNENTQMVIRLRPEHLGEITLRVSITAEGVVNASFRSDNAQVRAILESSMVQLKQQLQEQGVKVDQVDVQSGLSEDFFSHGQAGQQDFQQNQSQSAQSQQLARRAFEEEAEGLSASGTAEAAEAEPGQAPMGADSGVDYRV